eukprot:SAG11_NODE_17284_length_523_cov_0.778302_2_plen_64_part_01
MADPEVALKPESMALTVDLLQLLDDCYSEMKAKGLDAFQEMNAGDSDSTIEVDDVERWLKQHTD